MPGPVVELKNPDMLSAVEGLQMLSDFIGEHIALLEERDEAMKLMRPDSPWPKGETLNSAIRNMLQAKLTAEGLEAEHYALLDRVASVLYLTPDEWTRDQFLVALENLKDSMSTFNGINTLTVSTIEPPAKPIDYEWHVWSCGARGVPWRSGGKALADFNALLVGGWEWVQCVGNEILLRRPVFA